MWGSGSVGLRGCVVCGVPGVFLRRKEESRDYENGWPSILGWYNLEGCAWLDIPKASTTS